MHLPPNSCGPVSMGRRKKLVHMKATRAMEQWIVPCALCLVTGSNCSCTIVAFLYTLHFERTQHIGYCDWNDSRLVENTIILPSTLDHPLFILHGTWSWVLNCGFYSVSHWQVASCQLPVTTFGQFLHCWLHHFSLLESSLLQLLMLIAAVVSAFSSHTHPLQSSCSRLPVWLTQERCRIKNTEQAKFLLPSLVRTGRMRRRRDRSN